MVEAVVATEEAEAVVEVVVDQEKMKKKNGFQSQNSVDSYELAKSSQWRYRVSPVFSKGVNLITGNLSTFTPYQRIPNCRLFPPQTKR